MIKVCRFRESYRKSDSRMKVKGELTQLGDQSPYFSITAEVSSTEAEELIKKYGLTVTKERI